jgi:hypothetical protein
MAQLERLDTLAEQINEEHRKVEAAMANTLQHARRAGKLLLEAKERTHHGEWLSWLEANFKGSARAAQMYMRVHSRWPDIEANTKSVSDLTLTGALGAIGPVQEADVTRERVEGPLPWAHVKAGEESTELREPFSVEERQDYAKRVAAQKKASRDAEERYRQEQRKRHTAMFMEVDAHVSKARRELKEAIDQGRDVQFSDAEVALLVRQGEAARDMASLFIGAVSGDSGTDWDAELYDLEQRRQWGAEGEAE